MNPLICPVKTPLGCYFYETQRNEIISVPEEVYRYIFNSELGKEVAEESVSKKTKEYVQELRDLGYLRESYVKKLEHPVSQCLDTVLERKVSKILLQLTQNCNLRCHYCIYSEEKNLETRSHSKKVMNFETAKRAIDFYKEHSIDCKEKAIGFYGGEPLLQFALIKEIVEYCNQVFRGYKIVYTMTTNGTLLTDEVIEFLVENNVYITLSIDGMKEIHDKNRRFINDTGTYDVVIKNLEKLKKKCKNELQYNINMVVDPDNDYQQIVQFFNEPIVKDVNVHFALVEEENEVKSESEQFSSEYEYQIFLGYVSYFREREFNAPDGLVKFEIHRQLSEEFHFTPTTLSDIAAPGGPCVPGETRLFVDCEGELLPCERVSETSECVRIGNIYDGFNIEKIRKLINISQITEEECKKCWAFSLCTTCVKFSMEGNELCTKSRLEHCKQSRWAAWRKMLEKILLHENMIHERKMRKVRREEA